MAGRYTAYSAYKESDEKWIGKVPEHWDVQRLGQFFEERREKVSDKDYPPLSVTMNGIVPQLETAAKTDAGDNRKLVLKNDFVINSRSDRKGSSGVSTLDGSVSLISIVMKPREIRPSYVHHLLRSYPFQEEFYRFGKGIVADLWSTNASEMRNIKLPIPSQHEQEQIANFLDHETAKIDTLIDKQQQLIKLLQEKRQAVISHAVTKGLNPDAVMKDSGVEWLGKVPEHWVVLSLGKITEDKCDGPFGSGLKSEHYTESGVLVVRLQNIKIGGYHDGEGAYIHEEYYKNSLSNHDVIAGDVLIAGLGDPNNPVGRACVAPEDIAPAMVKADCFRFRLNSKKAISSFIANQLSVSAWADAGRLSNGSTRARIPLNLMATRKVAICPLNEQLRIVEHIKALSEQYDKIELEASKAIELLQERRTALISAAVTGKIDVRNWQPAQAEIPREASA
ncbi:MAG: restriction endonuclease subunit S [Desulfobulbaceae bacterium]|nr:restriction endonuclease subunit S [Desulfobulbaceae bacterium]HIJ91584.1 restriction endonuclease subunit S [Deltaproteobacteria bacterium]